MSPQKTNIGWAEDLVVNVAKDCRVYFKQAAHRRPGTPMGNGLFGDPLDTYKQGPEPAP